MQIVFLFFLSIQIYAAPGFLDYLTRLGPKAAESSSKAALETVNEGIAPVLESTHSAMSLSVIPNIQELSEMTIKSKYQELEIAKLVLASWQKLGEMSPAERFEFEMAARKRFVIEYQRLMRSRAPIPKNFKNAKENLKRFSMTFEEIEEMIKNSKIKIEKIENELNEESIKKDGFVIV